MVFWEHEEHEVAYSWLWALKMWAGNGFVKIPGAAGSCRIPLSGSRPDPPGASRCSLLTPLPAKAVR
eukprot:8697348-Pyramimonas_sp.AAC.1